VVRVAAVLAVATLSFAPLAERFDGTVGAPPWAPAAARWLIGSWVIYALAIGVAAVGERSRGSGALERTGRALDTNRGLLAAALGLAALALFAAVSRVVFDALPINVDEVAQVRQAQIFLGGQLTAPGEQPPEFFGSFLMVERDGRTFSQFPPGWSLVLALGALLRARWLMGPLAGAAGVLGLVLLARASGESPRVALGAGALLAVSPFFFLNAGSLMSHTPTVALVLLGSAALVHAVRSENDRRLLAGAAGVCLALAATVRPTDAIAFLVPAFGWLAWRAVRDLRRIPTLLAFSVAAAAPVVLLLAYDNATTGDPFMLGYVAQWGAAHGLGFHEAPWGPPHTPARGLAAVNAYLRAMQQAAFESPLPALLLPLLAVALARRIQAADRYLLAGCGFVLVIYWSYWFAPDATGGYLGPRYLLPLLPVAALWTARLPRIVREASGSQLVGASVTPLIVLMVLAGVPGMLARGREYAERYPTRRIAVDDLAAAQGIANALVLVPGSWADELSARMWGRGLSRPEGLRAIERAGFDLCELQRRVNAAERGELTGPRAAEHLMAFAQLPQRDAALETPPATAACAARQEEEGMGAWPFYPFQIARAHGNLYARDLHERNEALLAAHPELPVYVARPDPLRGGPQPVFVALNVDSARAVWRTRAGP
jgi:4-amino-4-deoxy-L-arabinose transferase-like glycosyltransferase